MKVPAANRTNLMLATISRLTASFPQVGIAHNDVDSNSQNEHKHHGRIVRTPAAIQIIANHVPGTQQEVQEGSGQSVLLYIPDIEHLREDRVPTQPTGVALLTAIGAVVSLILLSAVQALMCLASHRLEVKGIALSITKAHVELFQFHYHAVLLPTFMSAMPMMVLGRYQLLVFAL